MADGLVRALAWVVASVMLTPPAAAQRFPEFVSKVSPSGFRPGVADPYGRNGVTLLKGVLIAAPSRLNILESIGYSDGWVSALYTVRIPNPLEGPGKRRPINVGICYFQAKDLTMAVDTAGMLDYARGGNPYRQSFRQRIDAQIAKEGGQIVGRVDHFESPDSAGEIVYWSYPARDRRGRRFTVFHRSEEMVMRMLSGTVHVVANCETNSALASIRAVQGVSISYSNRVW